MKAKFPAGKGGDTAFKVMPDGSFLNAYTTINDSFKIIEDAISVCNANSNRPTTNPASTGRAGTALSGKSKNEAANANVNESVADGADASSNA